MDVQVAASSHIANAHAAQHSMLSAIATLTDAGAASVSMLWHQPLPLPLWECGSAVSKMFIAFYYSIASLTSVTGVNA